MSPYNNANEPKQKYRYGFNPYIKSQYNYLQNSHIIKITSRSQLQTVTRVNLSF